MNAARVQGGIGSVHANEGGDVIDGGILEKDVDKLLLALGHARKADRFRRLRDAQNHTRVLHRKEAFGDDDKKKDRAHESADGDQQGDEAMPQNDLQGAAIPRDDIVEDFLRPVVEATLLGNRFVLENARAHHRCEGE